MSSYWGKQRSSRILKAQNLAWTGSGTVTSTNFTAQMYGEGMNKIAPNAHLEGDEC